MTLRRVYAARLSSCYWLTCVWCFLDALHILWAAGVQPMDVKPGNAMLSVSVSYQIYTQDKQQQGWANCTSMVTLWRPSYKPVPKKHNPSYLLHWLHAAWSWSAPVMTCSPQPYMNNGQKTKTDHFFLVPVCTYCVCVYVYLCTHCVCVCMCVCLCVCVHVWVRPSSVRCVHTCVTTYWSRYYNPVPFIHICLLLLRYRKAQWQGYIQKQKSLSYDSPWWHLHSCI